MEETPLIYAGWRPEAQYAHCRTSPEIHHNFEARLGPSYLTALNCIFHSICAAPAPSCSMVTISPVRWLRIMYLQADSDLARIATRALASSSVSAASRHMSEPSLSALKMSNGGTMTKYLPGQVSVVTPVRRHVTRTCRSDGSCGTSGTATREMWDVLVALRLDTSAAHPRGKAFSATCSAPADFLDLPCSGNSHLWHRSSLRSLVFDRRKLCALCVLPTPNAPSQ